ncbi:hypothetical protein [Bacillus pseudomycoides]|uniref:hypothetical protein n=1 Tax=Bacillus pseudomycoides TaxID=64104 RepID=UPI0020D25EA1|nr:hypothetical protein [Bacillus pseudomycoides]
MKKIIISVSLFLSIGILIFFLTSLTNKSDNVSLTAKSSKTTEEKTNLANGITMSQAYLIGLQEAQKFDNVCELIYIGSVDDGQNGGHNGKRKDWNMIIALMNQKKRVIVSIKNSHLKKASVLEELNEPTINWDEIKVDSNIAVEKAIQTFSLSPGQNVFSKGYHFRLFKDDNNIFLSVIGNKDHKEAEIFFDGVTGNYLGRTEMK